MALQSDSEGFLRGDPISVDRGSFGRALALWQKIHRNTEDIRDALAGGGKPRQVFTDRQVNTVAQSIAGRVAAATRSRAPRVATPAREGASPVRENAPAPFASPARPVAVPERGAKGRFVGKNKPADDQKDDPRGEPSSYSGEPSRAARAASAMAESVKSGIAEAMSGADQVDPAIAATKEIGGMVGPLLKPVGALFGGAKGLFSRKKDREAAAPHVPWYKRIFKELRLLNKKPSGGGESGSPLSIGGIAGALAAVLPALGGLLVAALPALVAVGGTLLAGGIGYLIGTLINNKWGQAISDAIWDASEWIKEKWGLASERITAAWTMITTKLSDIIDGVKSVPARVVQGAKSVGERASEWASGVADKALGFVGKGSEGNRQALLAQMDAAGMTNPTERAMFLAQMDHESGGFRSLSENLKYSAQGLRSTFGKYYKTDAEAQAHAGNPEAIANKVYGGRMGNVEPGDGYRFRGRGFTQLTGRAQYAEAGKDLGLDLVNNPDLASDPAVAAKIATWYWKKRGISAAAQSGDVDAVTRKINGGTNGLADRQAKFSSYSNTVAAGGFAAAPSVPMSMMRQSAAPSIDKLTPGPMAPVSTAIGSNDKGGGRTEVIIPQPITQNLSDRSIAHVATGGIGGG